MKKDFQLDDDERQLADAYDAGELATVEPTSDLLRKLSLAGENTFKKDRRINVRLSEHDLVGIQRKAAQKGIPYQTLISGIIHQYVEGDLLERRT